MTTTTSTTYQPAVAPGVSGATHSRLLSFLFGAAGIVAFIGWLDTTMLTAIHYAILPLPEGARVEGTGWEVLTSPWAYILGIPTSLFGAFFYLMILALVMTWQFRGLPHLERLLLPLTAAGVLSSAIFVYLQLAVIQAICPFCMVSAGTSTLLFLLALAIYRNSRVPSIRRLGFANVDAKAIALPVAFVAVPMAALAMLHLATVLPLPIPK
jgi:uncharacterized membrane protein